MEKFLSIIVFETIFLTVYSKQDSYIYEQNGKK